MKKDKLHPLDYWLLDKDMSLPAFAAAHGIKLRALYNHVDPDWAGSPILSTMQAVEKATKGAVSVQQQSNWMRTR